MATKEKNKRQCNYKVSSKTLDLRHQSQMIDFDEKRNLLKDYSEELETLNSNYTNIQKKSKKDLDDKELMDLINIKDEINSINNKIKNIENNHHEIDYFVNTGDVLFEYYSLLDNSNNSPNSVNLNLNNVFPKKSPINNSSTNKKKCVIDFFNNSSKDESNVYNKNVDISINENNRAHLLDKYLSHTDINYIDNTITNVEPNICEFCKTNTLYFSPNESIYVCDTCNTIEKVITDNEKPSYKDPPKEISYFSYKRINHYTEWLNQIQGKETTEIPDEVFKNIIKELKKQRIYDYTTVTRSKIKEILKKSKQNKYYEHIPYILNRITGNPNPHLSPELEDKLKQMFKSIQVPFLKYSPLNRKNFLSYSYVIHKFLQLLDQDEYLKYFPLLKSREKLHQQEDIWKKICVDLNWQYIKSI